MTVIRRPASGVVRSGSNPASGRKVRVGWVAAVAVRLGELQAEGAGSQVVAVKGNTFRTTGEASASSAGCMTTWALTRRRSLPRLVPHSRDQVAGFLTGLDGVTAPHPASANRAKGAAVVIVETAGRIRHLR
ncbi:MAG: hypothetical protein JO242_23620, partial [Streptosporangiaceae bacterium]|nr:hypothetical protein [Streptosporangiaceae bacterium]